MNRVWAMPNKQTFKVKPIMQFIQQYIDPTTVSIDPFAGNNNWCTYSNDLNPNTIAQYHMSAFDFLLMLSEKNVKANLIIFDPPYSIRQVKECYESIGVKKFTYSDTLNAVKWTKEKEVCSKLLLDNGIFLHFGWHTNGMGKKHNTEIIEILLVAHGSGHHDTICMAEKKVKKDYQTSMFNS